MVHAMWVIDSAVVIVDETEGRFPSVDMIWV